MNKLKIATLFCWLIPLFSLTAMENEKVFFKAVWDGNIEIVTSLLQEGFDPNQLSSDGKYALAIAVNLGNVAMAKVLLDNSAQVNVLRGPYQRTFLMRAAYKGDLKMVELLLTYKADIDVKDRQQRNALMDASRYGHYTVVKVLLENDARVNEVNSEHCTALQWAREFGHHDIACLLKAYGAKRNCHFMCC